MRVEDLFDEAAFSAVEEAVRLAEERTSGEIVPMIVDRSDYYPGVRAAGAAALAFGAGAVVLSLDLTHALWLPPIQLGVFGLGAWALGWRRLLRHLVPPRIRAERVDRAARLAFLEHGVVETRDRTGILIYVSLLEHRVEVLADRGIAAHVPDGTWDGVVGTILEGIRARRAEQGLIDAVRRCGDILAERFPPRPDDEDELSNRPRT